jgi:hypothetical protein
MVRSQTRVGSRVLGSLRTCESIVGWRNCWLGTRLCNATNSN